MIKILYCQTIFLASENLKEKNFNSLKSLKYIIEDLPSNCKIIFKIKGWCYKEKFWIELVDLIKTLPIDIEFSRLDHNYGKSYTVNKIISECKEDFDYILTCDSDIVFLENQHYIERLLEFYEKFSEKKIGLLALNQKGMNCHIYSEQTTVINYEGKFFKEEIRGTGGIAGGCFFISKEIWKKVNGYDCMGVFCGEDGMLMSKIFRSGLKCFLIKTLDVYHPYDFPGENYRKWKRKQKLVNNNITEKILEKMSKISVEELWNKE